MVFIDKFWIFYEHICNEVKEMCFVQQPTGIRLQNSLLQKMHEVVDVFCDDFGSDLQNFVKVLDGKSHGSDRGDFEAAVEVVD